MRRLDGIYRTWYGFRMYFMGTSGSYKYVAEPPPRTLDLREKHNYWGGNRDIIER